MQSLELTAKTVEEAKKMAAERLGVAEDQVQVTVLEETKGLFGKMQLRVRAEAAAAAKTEEAPKPKGKSAVKETPKETVEAVQEGFEPKAEDQKKETRRGGRDNRRGGKKQETEAAPAAEESQEERSEGGSASEADGEVIVGVLRDLLDSANLQVTAKVKEISGRYVNIQLDGKDAAHLVGKHGEVINALQYLLNIIVQKQVPSGARATLDANDYRRRREDALTKLATRIAEQVLDRQEEAVLDALPAFERRIVHKALGTISGVQTYSEGEEPNRRVVIAPAE